MRITLFVLLHCFAAQAFAEQPIGFLQLPEAQKSVLERKGEPQVAMVAGQQGEIWHESERSKRELRKFAVHQEPSVDSEVIIDIDVSGSMFALLTESKPGSYKFNSLEKARRYDTGKSKVLVFEKRGEWVRVKFLDHPPWDGRFGWIRLGVNTGGFLSVN